LLGISKRGTRNETLLFLPPAPDFGKYVTADVVIEGAIVKSA
jgi:hypothetical protein